MPALPTTDGAYISWNPVSGSGGYIIGISDGPGQPIIQQKTTSGTSVTFGGLPSCHQYYYQVVTQIGWHIVEDGYFTTVRPASNVNVIVNSPGDVSISWTPSCGSLHNDQYVDIGTSPGGTQIGAWQVEVGAAWFNVPLTLVPGTYYVRVNNKFGYQWFPSPNVAFTVTPERTPATNLQPNNITIQGTEVTLSWTPGSGFGFFHEQVDLIVYGENWTDALKFSVPAGQNTLHVTGLVPGITFVWRVETAFNNPPDVLISDMASFTVAGGIPTRNPATNLQPDGATVPAGDVTLTWTPGSGDGYAGQELDIIVYPGQSWDQGQHIPLPASQSSYTFYNVPAAGYAWRILSSFDNPADVLISSIASFIVQGGPPPNLIPATLLQPANNAQNINGPVVTFRWTRGTGAPIDSQALVIIVYPGMSWADANIIPLSAGAESYDLGGFTTPGLGFAWKIMTFFQTASGIQQVESDTFAFIIAGQGTRYPASNLSCVPAT